MSVISITRRKVLAAAVLFAYVAVPARPAHPATTATIQPGTAIHVQGAPCTAGFVFHGVAERASEVYVGIAAHCVNITGVGTDVATTDGTVFGDVAWIGDPVNPQTDYAFVRVRSAYLAHVDPAVKEFPAYPARMGTLRTTKPGDPIQFSGRQSWTGTVLTVSAQVYRASGSAFFGDSGGPVVDLVNGGALGLVSRPCLTHPGCNVEGPTVEGMIRDAAARGFSVRLTTA